MAIYPPRRSTSYAAGTPGATSALTTPMRGAAPGYNYAPSTAASAASHYGAAQAYGAKGGITATTMAPQTQTPQPGWIQAGGVNNRTQMLQTQMLQTQRLQMKRNGFTLSDDGKYWIPPGGGGAQTPYSDPMMPTQQPPQPGVERPRKSVFPSGQTSQSIGGTTTYAPGASGTTGATGGGLSSIAGELASGTADPAQLIQQLIQQNETAQEEARETNEERYQELLEEHDALESQAMGLLEGAGAQESADIAARWKGEASKGQQGLISSGLAGTTVAPTMSAMYARLGEADQARLSERLRMNELSVLTGLRGQKLGTMERREDTYPDTTLLANLASQLGEWGQGQAQGTAATTAAPATTTAAPATTSTTTSTTAASYGSAGVPTESGQSGITVPMIGGGGSIPIENTVEYKELRAKYLPQEAAKLAQMQRNTYSRPIDVSKLKLALGTGWHNTTKGWQYWLNSDGTQYITGNPDTTDVDALLSSIGKNNAYTIDRGTTGVGANQATGKWDTMGQAEAKQSAAAEELKKRGYKYILSGDGDEMFWYNPATRHYYKKNGSGFLTKEQAKFLKDR